MEHPIFYFKAYTITPTPDGLSVVYNFSAPPDLTFKHTITFSGIQVTQHDQARLTWLVEQLGFVELLSYWKAVGSAQIAAPCVDLAPEQIKFWMKLYVNGMGEFFYKNKIDFTPTDFLQLIPRSTQLTTLPLQPTTPADEQRVLIPIGGGKDSSVTAELLKAHVPVTGFILNPNPAELAINILATGKPPISAKRQLDPKLFALNAAGAPNGHSPFSATLAWLSLIAAELGNFTAVAVSNERSSNEGTTNWLGHSINHQYSKTKEFEIDFQAYIQPFTPIRYFSFVRPLYELQIAKLFSTMPHYFSAFRSCNRGQKINSWCGECPKCLSLALILLPWVGADLVKTIIGKNPFENSANIQILRELCGLTPTKPFECVLTTEEALVSGHLCVQSYQLAGEMMPIVLKEAQSILSKEKNMDERAQTLLDSFEHNSNTPEPFEEILSAAYHDAI